MKAYDEQDEDDEELGVKLANLAALEEHRREIHTKLRTVINSLREYGAVANGYDSAYFLESTKVEETPDKVGLIHEQLFHCRRILVQEPGLVREKSVRFEFDPPDRYRAEFKIAPLGEVKCQSIWELFDLDQDGTWSYDEFLEYMTALERHQSRPEMVVFTENSEIWRMYMSDLFETDSRFHLTFQGFLMYRESIEEDTPLANDLKLLHISLEWPALERMRLLGRLFDDCADTMGAVSIHDAQFLFAESGYPLTYLELCQTIQRQRYLGCCLKYILQRKRTLRLFGYWQKSTVQFTNSVLEEEPRICKAAFRSLVFSSWTPARQTRWRRFLLGCRLNSFTVLRRWKRNISWGFKWIRKAARTGLLRASCLLSTAERERGDYILKLNTGQTFSTHASLHLTYISDADSAATLHELKYLERGAECFFYVDLVCRSGTRENDIQLVTQRLNWFLDEFFREHLETLPFFHKWFVTIPTKLQLRSSPGIGSVGGAPVIRIVVLFTGEMDLYQVMQSLYLPSSMQFDHLLERFSLRWLCSHSLEDMLTNKRFVLGSQWSCRAQMDIRLNRQAWAQIFRQLGNQLEDERQKELEDLAYIKQEKLKHQEQLQQKTVHTSKFQPSHSDKPTEKYKDDDPNLPVIEEATNVLHSSQHDNDEHRQLRYWFDRIAQFLDCSHQISGVWSFANLNDLLFGNKWLPSVLSPQWFQHLKYLFTVPGALANEWKAGCDGFRAEFASNRCASQSSAVVSGGGGGGGGGGGSRIAYSRASSRSSLQSAEDAGQTSDHSTAASFPFVSPVSTSEAAKRSTPVLPSARQPESSEDGNDEHVAKAKDLDKDIAIENELLEFYDLCVRHLQGVHVIRAEAGTSGLTCVLDGWNLFSLLPRVVQGQIGKKTVLKRTKSSASSSSNSGGTTGMSRPR